MIDDAGNDDYTVHVMTPRGEAFERKAEECAVKALRNAGYAEVDVLARGV